MSSAENFNKFVEDILATEPGETREHKYRGAKVVDLRGLEEEQKNELITKYKQEIVTRTEVNDYNDLKPIFAFASGKTSEQEFLKSAYEFGSTIAEHGKVCITGAGGRSCMYECSKGARDADGISIGVMTPGVFPIEGVAEHDDEGPILHYLFLDDTIDKRLDTAHAFATIEKNGIPVCNTCAMAGGWGTVEEILEERLTGGKAVLQYPFWKTLHSQLQLMHEWGLSATPPDDYIETIETPDALKTLEQKTQDTTVQPISHILAESAEKLRQELSHDGYHNVHISGTSLMRKFETLQKTMKKTDAFVILPGDVHVFRELVGMIVEKRIAKKTLEKAAAALQENPHNQEAANQKAEAEAVLKKKVYLVNEKGFYEPFLQLYEQLKASGMLDGRVIENGKGKTVQEDLFAFIDVVNSKKELRGKLEADITTGGQPDRASTEGHFPIKNNEMIVIGTTNKAKAEEISATMKSAGYRHVHTLWDIKRSPQKFGLKQFNFDEQGGDTNQLKQAGTFEAIAAKKAEHWATQLSSITYRKAKKTGAFIITEQSGITIYENSAQEKNGNGAEAISHRRILDWCDPEDASRLNLTRTSDHTSAYRSVVALAHTSEPQLAHTFYGANRELKNQQKTAGGTNRLYPNKHKPIPHSPETTDDHTVISAEGHTFRMSQMGLGMKLLVHPRGHALKAMLHLACGKPTAIATTIIAEASEAHGKSPANIRR